MAEWSEEKFRDILSFLRDELRENGGEVYDEIVMDSISDELIENENFGDEKATIPEPEVSYRVFFKRYLESLMQLIRMDSQGGLESTLERFGKVFPEQESIETLSIELSENEQFEYDHGTFYEFDNLPDKNNEVFEQLQTLYKKIDFEP
ncbi:MAG: hypothetical protein ABEJ65_02395 [bacterium]